MFSCFLLWENAQKKFFSSLKFEFQSSIHKNYGHVFHKKQFHDFINGTFLNSSNNYYDAVFFFPLVSYFLITAIEGQKLVIFCKIDVLIKKCYYSLHDLSRKSDF